MRPTALAGGVRPSWLAALLVTALPFAFTGMRGIEFSPGSSAFDRDSSLLVEPGFAHAAWLSQSLFSLRYIAFITLAAVLNASTGEAWIPGYKHAFNLQMTLVDAVAR